MDAAKSKSPQSFLRQLRDANRDDTDLVRLCNETIQIIKNLKKEEAYTSDSSREAVKNMRAKLVYNTEWLDRWKLRQPAINH